MYHNLLCKLERAPSSLAISLWTTLTNPCHSLLPLALSLLFLSIFINATTFLTYKNINAQIWGNKHTHTIIKYVNDIQNRTKEPSYAEQIAKIYDSNGQITGENVTFDTADGSTPPERKVGKVRDRYDVGDVLALVTTDRQSGFDRMLAKVPYKVRCGVKCEVSIAGLFSEKVYASPFRFLYVFHCLHSMISSSVVTRVKC